MNPKIKAIVETTETLSGKVFDLVIQLFILISLFGFTFETLPNLNQGWANALRVSEIICVGVFTIEYLLRVLAADKKLKFVFSFYGLIDLAAILPFYIASGIDLRSIRIFRLFRLLWVMKILRFNSAIERFRNAFLQVKNDMIVFGVSTGMLLYLTSVGIYYFENPVQPDEFASIFHCMWWAIVTLTTVGYGDVYPVTVGGKIFTSVILIIGLGVVAVPTGLIASALTNGLKK